MSVDIVVSFDTTGSMYPALAEVRRKVSDLITTLFAHVPDLRMGIITHGDYVDGDLLLTTHPLSTDKTSLVQFVKTAPQTGGGDAPEAYEYILKVARELYTWRSEAKKVLVLIGDATPHEVGYRYPGNTIRRLTNHSFVNLYDWKVEAKELVNHGITIYPIQALNHYGSKGFYESLATISNTPKLDLHQFSNIIPILTVVVFAQQDITLVEQYGQELDSIGGLNRNIATVIDLLLGKEVHGTKFDRPTTLYAGHDSELKEVDPSRFQVLHVDHDVPIKQFVVDSGAVFKIGRGFYQLTKTELVQERKEVVLVDKRTGDMWSGAKAREMIGLPYGERGKIHPPYGFGYDVYIQSTSANRKLMGGTKFLYEAK